MEKVVLGKSGICVSRIGFGVLPVGSSHMNLPVSEGSQLIEYALSRGINFLDTAEYYDTYRYIRPALDHLRSKCPETFSEPVISTKSLARDASSMSGAVRGALKELGRRFIDIFLLHEVLSPEDFTDRRAAWEELERAKEKGIVRAIGLSTHHQDVAEMAADIEELDVVFPLINKDGLGIRVNRNSVSTADQSNMPGSAQGMARAIKKCADNGKGVYGMKIFGGGNLVEEYTACMDFAFGLDGLRAVMIGFTEAEHVDAAIAYAENELDPGYRPDVSKKLMHVCKDDCIGCGACIKRCSSHAISWGSDGLAEIDTSSCVKCGYCAPVCPVRAILMY